MGIISWLIWLKKLLSLKIKAYVYTNLVPIFIEFVQFSPKFFLFNMDPIFVNLVIFVNVI